MAEGCPQQLSTTAPPSTKGARPRAASPSEKKEPEHAEERLPALCAFSALHPEKSCPFWSKMLVSPAHRNYPHRTGILINISPSNISTNDYTIFNCSTSKDKESHTLRTSSAGTQTGLCLASVFLEIALSTKGGTALFTLHDPNPDILWLGGLGFVCFDFST